MTIEQIKHTHRDAGGYFFEPSTLRFFASRIGKRSYVGPGGVYFTTSEQFRPSTGPPAPRRYSVRRFNPDNPSSIDTVGEFQGFASRDGASAMAVRCAAWGPTDNNPAQPQRAT